MPFSTLSRSRHLTSVALAAGLALGATSSSTDFGPGAPDPEFGNHLMRAKRGYEAGVRLAALDALDDARRLLQDELHDQLLAALPRAPLGYRVDTPPERPPSAAPPGGGTPSFAPPFATTGPKPVERRYRESGGNGLLKIQLVPRSPQAEPTLRLLAGASERAQHEVVEIGDKQLLVVHGRGRTAFRMVLDGGHLLEVSSFGVDDETALKLFDIDTLQQFAELLR